MPHAEVNGQRLYYEDSGGDGPAVVFSHGFLMDHSMFDPQVAALRDRYRVITWDERGHGDSGEVSEAFTYWDSAEDVRALLTSLGLERAVLGGMSQGGFLSLRAALAHPEMVQGLILIDTQAGVEDPEKLPYYTTLLERWNTSGMDDELGAIIGSIILGAGWAGTEVWQRKWAQMPPGNVNTAFATLATREDIDDRLGEITAPALVIHGESDAAIDLAVGRRLAEGLPQAELVTVPGAGHASNLTHPEPVNAAIERFLARVTS